jgi:glutamyl/glutaminyl-tRNA synthetase
MPRYDDTNPDGEEESYVEWILKIIKWLGSYLICSNLSFDFR